MKKLIFLWVVVAAGASIVILTGIDRSRRAEAVGEEAEKTPPPGMWKASRTPSPAPTVATAEQPVTAAEQEMLKQLEAIGYLTGSEKGHGGAGVRRYDTSKVASGANFYTSGHTPGAVLMDMNGKIRHRWTKAFFDIWPKSEVEKDNVNTQYWRRAHLFENGDVLAIYEGIGLVKLDKRSKVIWANPIKAHHDLEVMQNGDIWTLTREAKIIPRVNKTKPIFEDFAVVLDSLGNLKQKVSLLTSLEKSPGYSHLWYTAERRFGDIFHTNAIRVLDGRIADRVSQFRRGNVLVSILMLSTIAVLDMDREEVVWAHQGGRSPSGTFFRQHDPKVLDNGHLLLFNNLKGRHASSVIELDPVTKAFLWEYTGTPKDPFFSEQCGTATRLPNGNTLIVESDNGRAFEVTKDQRIVWEYLSPHRAGKNGELVATLFDLKRLPEGFPLGWAGDKGR